MLRIGVTLVWILLAIAGFSQELVKDINTEPGGVSTNSGQLCYPCGGLVYLSVANGAGRELWKTDGTAEGTTIVMDLYPGPESGFQGSAKCINNRLFFIGRTSGFNFELFSSDGSDIIAVNEVLTRNFAPFQDMVISSSINELWRSSLGTTSLIKNFSYDGLFVEIKEVYGGSEDIYILLYVANELEIVRYELWKSNGTEIGTTLLQTFPGGNETWPRDLTEAGSLIYFFGSDEIYGNELWKSDGTPEGTVRVPNQIGSYPSILGVFNNKLVFSNHTEKTYITDGTAGGTSLLFEGYSNLVRVINNKLYGIARYGDDDVFFESDGTFDGTKVLNTLGPKYGINLNNTIPAVNDRFILPFYSPELGLEISYSLGGINDLTLLKDINVGTNSSRPTSFGELSNQVVFIADNGIHGAELWSTDGTQESTLLLKDLKPGTESSVIRYAYTLNGKLYFSAGKESFRKDLWLSDGTPDGTKLYHDFDDASAIGSINNELFVYNGYGEFWRTNGKLDGTALIEDFSNLSFGLAFSSRTAGDNLYFYMSIPDYGFELYRWNTAQNDIKLVKDIYPGPASSRYTSRAAAIDDRLVISTNDGVHGNELWITDGTEEGTQMIKDINPESADPLYITAAGGIIFFRANDGIHGTELWKTDGTEAGTVMIKDIIPLEAGSTPTFLTKFKDGVVFVANDGIHGEEPWISDGTAVGTHMIKDLNQFGNSSALTFYEFKDKLYFTANDGIHGIELWQSDGTESGTILIDLVPGEASSIPTRFADDGGTLFFQANEQVWRGSGTPESIEMIGDFEPASEFYVVNGYLCFIYSTEAFGSELFRVSIDQLSKMPQGITFQPISTKTLGDPAFNLSATASSGLEVLFTPTSDKVSISNSEVTLLKAGEVTINADQPGDSFFEAANTVSQTFCINPPKPTITIDNANPSRPVLTSSSANGNEWYRNRELLTDSNITYEVEESGTYKVLVFIDGCESEFSEEQSFVITGLEEEIKQMEIYPNPAANKISINDAEGQSFRILGSSGKEVITGVVPEGNQIDISTLPVGIYVIQLISGKEIVNTRWVKK